jgi:hypothetical protein
MSPMSRAAQKVLLIGLNFSAVGPAAHDLV